METAPKLVSLTAALLMTLTQWFNDGMRAYSGADFNEAAAAFTKIVEAKVEPNPFRDLARFYRAQAYNQLDDIEAAVADLETLLTNSPSGPLAAVAAAQYAVISGKDWRGVRLSSPAATWQSLLTAVTNENHDAISLCCAGNILEEFDRILRAANAAGGWTEVAREMADLEIQETVYNVASNKACIRVGKPGSARTEALLMLKRGAGWVLVDEFDPREHSDFMGGSHAGKGAQARLADDAAKIQLIADAMRAYVMQNQVPPPDLKDLADLLADYNKNSVSCVDGNPFVVAYPNGSQVPWVFTSTPTNGQRQVYMNNQVRIMQEDTFRELARSFGVQVPHDWSDMRITEAERKLIAKLIEQLGASSFRVRTEAYRKLKAIGSCAGPQLEAATENPDPEIAIQAKKLLSEL